MDRLTVNKSRLHVYTYFEDPRAIHAALYWQVEKSEIAHTWYKVALYYKVWGQEQYGL